MELEITWGRVFRVWWAYTWRNLIALVIAVIVGWKLGYFLGYVAAATGIPTYIIRSSALPLGFLFGFVTSMIVLKMILGKTYGDFRLVLLSAVS
jgi:hypothetical protein